MNLKTLRPILRKLYSIKIYSGVFLRLYKFKIIKKPSSTIEEGFFVNCFNSLTLVIELQMRHGKYE